MAQNQTLHFLNYAKHANDFSNEHRESADSRHKHQSFSERCERKKTKTEIVTSNHSWKLSLNFAAMKNFIGRYTEICWSFQSVIQSSQDPIIAICTAVDHRRVVRCPLVSAAAAPSLLLSCFCQHERMCASMHACEHVWTHTYQHWHCLMQTKHPYGNV